MHEFKCPDCQSDNIVKVQLLWEQKGLFQFAPPSKPNHGGWVCFFLCIILSFIFAKYLHTQGIVFASSTLYTESQYLVGGYILAANTIIAIVFSFVSLLFQKLFHKYAFIAYIKVAIIAAIVAFGIYFGSRALFYYIGWMDSIYITSDWAWVLFALLHAFLISFMMAGIANGCEEPAYNRAYNIWQNTYQCKRCGKLFYYDD